MGFVFFFFFIWIVNLKYRNCFLIIYLIANCFFQPFTCKIAWQMCILWKRNNFAMCPSCSGRILQMYYNYNQKLSAQTFSSILLSFNSPLVIVMAIISSVVSDLLFFTNVMIIGWCRATFFLKYCIGPRNEPLNHLEKKICNFTKFNAELHALNVRHYQKLKFVQELLKNNPSK